MRVCGNRLVFSEVSHWCPELEVRSRTEEDEALNRPREPRARGNGATWQGAKK